MKVWQLLDDNNAVVAAVPVTDLLDPLVESRGRQGFGVYEALDASGAVLYTGRTGSLDKRLKAHSTQSSWWGFAVAIRWTPTLNYGETVALERLGISTDHGGWNGTGHRDLPIHARRPLPRAMADRLTALYAATPANGKSVDFDNYIATARHLGWTLSALGEVLSITREAVRLRSLRGVVDHDLFIPSPPPARTTSGKVWPSLRPGEAEEMRELQAMATRVRGNTAVDHPNRIASERLAEMLADVRLRGVRDREVAEALGITKEAIRFRLARHGYTKNPPSQPNYQPGSGDRRSDSCKRGHEFAGANLLLVKGDPARRVCRACNRIRSATYAASKKERAA